MLTEKKKKAFDFHKKIRRAVITSDTLWHFEYG